MSNQSQTVTLQTAVLIQVKEFAKNNENFSIHDITRNIRAKASSGDLDIPETVISGTSFRNDIHHVKVKALFDELWRTGVFDPDFTLSRQFNGTYFEYTPSSVNNVVTVSPVTPATSITTNAATITTPPFTTPASLGNVFVGPDRDTIKSRITTYLTRCADRNFRPTIKSVQSAIKRGNVSTGWSCLQIRDIIESDLDFNVISDPFNNISSDQVATV